MRYPSDHIRWDSNDHGRMVPYMLACLVSDGYGELAGFIQGMTNNGEAASESIAVGARSADNPLSPYWVNVVAHFHDPCNHKGLEGFPYSAADAARDARASGIVAWQSGEYREALVHLGRALHVICDIAGIPHHAANIGYLVADPYGHRDYENWLRDDQCWRRYTVNSGGYYAPWQNHHNCSTGIHATTSDRPYDWADQAAVAARQAMPLVDKHHPGFQENFPAVATQLVAASIRWSAGFIHHFFTDRAVQSSWPEDR